MATDSADQVVWRGPEQLRGHLVPLRTLRPDPDNANTHPAKNLTAIRGSFGRYGQQKALVVTEGGVIVAGNGAWEALHQPVPVYDADGVRVGEEQWTHVAAVTTDLAPGQMQGFAITDNRTQQLSVFDDDVLAEQLGGMHEDGVDLAALGWDDDDLADLLGDSWGDPDPERRGLNDPDTVPERPADPVTQPGDVWVLGDHTLVCGDATDPASYTGVDDVGVPLVFTSFPYGVGLDYGPLVHDTFENVRRLLAAMAPLLGKLVRPGGYCVTNFADVVAGRDIVGVDEPCEYPASIDYWSAFRAAGWLLHTRRIWAKPHAKVSAPWTANSNRSACDWEHLWTWRRPGRQGLCERRDRSALGVWDSSKLEGVEVGKDIHPAAFPAGIATLVLKIYSDRGDLVVDPFGGTGTVLVAAHRTGRRAHLVELEPAWCDVIVRRFQDHTGIVPVHAQTGESVDFTAAGDATA